MNRKRERFIFFLAITLCLAGIGTIFSSPLFLERRISNFEINDEQVSGIESNLHETTTHFENDNSKLTVAYKTNEKITSKPTYVTTKTIYQTKTSTSETPPPFTITTKRGQTTMSKIIQTEITTALATAPTILAKTTIQTSISATVSTTISTTTTIAETTKSTLLTTTPAISSSTMSTTAQVTTPLMTTITSTTISTTTTTCEDKICQQGGICHNQNNPVKECPDLYTGVDCEVPPTFVRQRDGNGMFMKAKFIKALNICLNQGGYLAFFINENEYLLYIENERETENMEYIGYYTCDHPKFITANGKNAIFEIWDDNEPNNHGGIENCGSIYGGDRKKMNDYNCVENLEFACRFPRLNTCEDYFCYYGGVCDYNLKKSKGQPECPRQQGNQVCTTKTTKIPTTTTTTKTTTTATKTATTTTMTAPICNRIIFEKQLDEHGTPLKRDYKDAHKICRRKGGYVSYFLDQNEFDEFKSHPDRVNKKEYLG